MGIGLTLPVPSCHAADMPSVRLTFADDGGLLPAIRKARATNKK
jgi:hypothetical protein